MIPFGLFNIAATALLVAAYIDGWIEYVWEADPTYLTSVIFGLFVVASVAAGLGRFAVATFVSRRLVLLGLIGTVIGFIIALSGVDPALVGDVNAIGPMVSRLIEGMGVALYTTLVASVLYFWLSFSLFLRGRDG